MDNQLATLCGRWRTDTADLDSVTVYDDASLIFESDGYLTYIIHLEDKDQLIRLRYEVRGDELITDQPSAPRQQTTRFAFTDDGKLELTLDGVKSTYVRESS